MQLKPADCDRQLDNEKGAVRGTDGPQGEDPFTCTKPFLTAPVPLAVSIVGVRADPLRKAQFIGLGRTKKQMTRQWTERKGRKRCGVNKEEERRKTMVTKPIHK